MIYYLQLGAFVPAEDFHNPPPGLPGWAAALLLDEATATAMSQLHPALETDEPVHAPLLFGPYQPDCYGNARAYRQAHLGLLAGYAGIEELLFDAGGYGLLATTPDVVPLRPEHLKELRESLAAFRRQYPEARCEYAGPDWPPLQAEPAFENQVLDLLVWLVFWAEVNWWEPQAPLPVLANMDYTKHPGYARIQALKR